MAKKYRVISAAALVAGNDAAQVVARLQTLGLKDMQARALVQKKLVIKQELNYQAALVYQERFAAAGLLVTIQPYQIDDPVAPDANVFTLLDEALITPFTPVNITKGYTLSLCLVMLASLIAPAIYFGILAGTGWGLWWYFTEGRELYLGNWDRNFWGIIFSCVVPAIAGSILILFLLYPLWPQGRMPKPFVLDRKKNAAFYRAIEQLAKAAGVPAPHIIEIIPEVNAAAGPTGGLVSLGRGQLKLMIGMSLVAGSNVQQLMGIIAHEFGHFAQRSGMMAYQLINRINRWLAECAYGQDAWRERLNRWMESTDFAAVQIPLLIAQVIIAMVRFLFKHLFHLSLRLTQSMSRQMEFDADRYETQLVGSHIFRANTLNLRKLAYAWQHVMEINYRALHEKDQLFRNIPAAVISLAKQFPPEFVRQIEADLHNDQTNFWDSHPADLDRIAYAEAAAEKGRLQCDLPAAVLFKEYEQLCEQISHYFYYLHGISGAKEFVVDNQQLLPRATV